MQVLPLQSVRSLHVMRADTCCVFLFAVCASVLNKFAETVTDKDRGDKEVLESKLKKFCKTLKGKDERFVSTCSGKCILY